MFIILHQFTINSLAVCISVLIVLCLLHCRIAKQNWTEYVIKKFQCTKSWEMAMHVFDNSELHLYIANAIGYLGKGNS